MPVARVRLSGVAPVSVTVPDPERLKVSTSLPPALNLSLIGVRVTVTLTEVLPFCVSVTEPKGEVPQLGEQLLSVKKVCACAADAPQSTETTNMAVTTKHLFNIERLLILSIKRHKHICRSGNGMIRLKVHSDVDY